MSLRKVVYSRAETVAAEGGYGVALDGRRLNTPARTPLVVPTDSLAEAIADEWRAQKDEIQPHLMPLTRLANSAIDKIPVQFAATVTALSEYAETDMTCYRAEHPAGLVARQAAAWDPPLAWLHTTHGITLTPTTGLIAVAQPPAARAAFEAWLAAQTPFALMALHDLIGLTGSIVLARALAEGAQSPDAVWQAAILDEMWNIAEWGEDAEAAALRASKRADFGAAHRFLQLQA